jgi:hypothetical protein
VLAMTQDRAEQDQRLSWAFESERRRLLAFIRRRIPMKSMPKIFCKTFFVSLWKPTG